MKLDADVGVGLTRCSSCCAHMGKAHLTLPTSAAASSSQVCVCVWYGFGRLGKEPPSL